MLKMSSRDINHAAIAKATGDIVEVVKQPGTRRVVFYFTDTPEINDLLQRFERREVLPIPAKCILNARTTLYHLAAAVARGEI